MGVWEGLAVGGVAFERYRLSTLIGQGGMGKVIAVAAAAIALAPFWVVATTPGVAQAAPCAGVGENPVSCQHCLFYVEAYHTANVCYSAPPRPAQAPPSTVPVQTPEAPPEPALREPAPAEPAPTTVTLVQTPQVVPPSPAPPSTIPVVAAHEEPTQPWWPSALRYGVLVIAVGLVAWMINRRKRERGSDG